MTSSRLQAIEEIYRAAVDKKPDQVGVFLETACQGDEILRRKVEALLNSRERAATFIETSAVGLTTRIIQNRKARSLVGQTIGHYKISESIGSGGMGEVYLATDIAAGRKAALKLLPMRFACDIERLKRFQQEAHAVVALNHPNILTVYEIGEDHLTHYIASELIEGETLRQRLVRGQISLCEAVDIAVQVASALAAAHDAGIVHRDIKPENIMLRRDGYVKVLDFGIAKLAESAFADPAFAAASAESAVKADEAESTTQGTKLSCILGTVRYMSPEQARAASVDKRTDIWSLGVVLYEMVTGHAPFTGHTTKETLSAILEREPPPVSSYVARSPPELRQILDKTLRKNREERYQSVHELLQALKGLHHKLEVDAEFDRWSAVPSWARWRRSPAAVVLILFVAGLGSVAAPLFFLRVNRQKLTSAVAGNIAPSTAIVTQLPEKSIAVLPFENLSKDKEDAFFAGGVQDEILNDLAKVADLKVISRTSVMKYKSGLERNVREIAKALGVSYVVEGSVERVGERVRVSAQLIDARNDTHLWAEHYDRDVADVFAIQSEIAQQIANQLQAKLSPEESAAIAERPTTDPMAYAYYTQAKELDLVTDWEGDEKSLNRKVELLEKATQRDPNFALAYCELAQTQIDLAHETDDNNYELARKAAETAVRLRPDLAETHLALASYYFADGVLAHNYDRTREELTIVRRKLPNNAEALLIEAMIGRHENRWDASLANLQKASELDPRNDEVAWRLWEICFEMRRYSECEQLLTKKAGGGDPWIQNLLAKIKLAQGDPAAAQSFLEQVPLEYSPDESIWDIRFKTALYLRDYDAANRAIAITPAKFAGDAFGGPSDWAEGQVARARGDKQKALAAFASARQKIETTRGDKAKDAQYLADLAKLDAGLGRKEEAIREAQHAVELLPIARDAVNGPDFIKNLALVYAWTGERDRALEQLEKIATIPGSLGMLTYGDLRFNPCWDDLRDDPRFDKIMAAAKAASK